LSHIPACRCFGNDTTVSAPPPSASAISRAATAAGLGAIRRLA
jgi:hypothetical protein